MLVLSIPAVQTKLGKYATKKVNEEFNTNINIGKVGLQFNGDVELKEIYIEDYKKDTLISIVELNTSILNFKKLYNGKLTFGDIDIEGLIMNIVTYKDEPETNLDVFVAKFDDDEPKKEKSDFLLSSSDLSIYDGTFRIINENKINPKVLEFTNLDVNTTNFLINGSDVSTRINTLAFNDSRGLRVENLSTDFAYTLQDMTFSKLNIKTSSSNVKGNLKFTYNREDLQYFTDKVIINATFVDTDVALNELNTFYNEFGKTQRAKFDVELSGTLNNLTATDLKLTTSSRSKIYGDIVFANLFNTADNNFAMDGNFTNLTSNYGDLKALLPNVLGEAIPSAFDLGEIISDLNLKKINDIDNASYKGNVVFKEFDLGTFLGDDKIKTTSLDLNVDGNGFKLENINTNLQGDIFELTYNNYTYKNIDVSGTLKNKVYNGILISNDKNFQLDFNGLADVSQKINKFDFVANVKHANLKVLNFVKNDSLAHFKGVVDMKMTGTTIDDAKGTITFKNTTYINENDSYIFDDFKITSSFQGEERTIDINSPDIIQGKLTGVFKLNEIGKLIENSLGSIYTNYQPHKISENQYVNFTSENTKKQ